MWLHLNFGDCLSFDETLVGILKLNMKGFSQAITCDIG